MKKLVLPALLIAVLLVAGCVSQPSGTTTADTTGGTDALSGVESEMSVLDSLDSDLDMADLENLETELEDLNW